MPKDGLGRNRDRSGVWSTDSLRVDLMPVVRPRHGLLALLLLWLPTLGVALPGCKRKCKPATSRFIDGYTRRLCAAEARSFRGEARFRGLVLARADRPPQSRIAAAPLLVVRARALILGDRRWSPWPTSAALQAAVAAALKAAPGGNPKAGAKSGAAPKPGPRLIHLAIAPQVPVARLPDLLGALHRAGVRRVSLLVTPIKGLMLPTPPDQSTRAKLERFVAREPLPQRRQLLERRLASLARETRCSPLGQVLAQTKRAAPDQRCTALTGALRNALHRCGCALDWRRVLTVAHLLLGPYTALGHFTVTLDPAHPGLAVSKYARWQDVVDRAIKAPADHFWLTLR